MAMNGRVVKNFTGDLLKIVANYLQVLGWDEHNTEKSHQEFQPTEPAGFPLPYAVSMWLI